MAWSEAKSNTLNRDLSTVRLRPRLTPTTAWSFAAAALVVLALIVSTVLHRQQEPLEASIASQPQLRANPAPAGNDSDRAREIAADNALLGAINSELRPQAPPSALFDPGPSNPRHSDQVQD